MTSSLKNSTSEINSSPSNSRSPSITGSAKRPSFGASGPRRPSFENPSPQSAPTTPTRKLSGSGSKLGDGRRPSGIASDSPSPLAISPIKNDTSPKANKEFTENIFSKHGEENSLFMSEDYEDIDSPFLSAREINISSESIQSFTYQNSDELISEVDVDSNTLESSMKNDLRTDTGPKETSVVQAPKTNTRISSYKNTAFSARTSGKNVNYSASSTVPTKIGANQKGNSAIPIVSNSKRVIAANKSSSK
jgi:hypothetical protein